MAPTYPSPEDLAKLVSQVTQTMFGMAFSLAPVAQGPASDQADWHTVVLPIPGAHPVTVAIAADRQAAAVIGGHMFSVGPDVIDDSMIDDAVAELANIVAGQVKAAMSLDQALGLPEVLRKEQKQRLALGPWREATLTSGSARTLVWVAVSAAKI